MSALPPFFYYNPQKNTTMDEKEVMTLVKTLTERIIDLQFDLKNAEEMKDFYYDKAKKFEAEVKELNDKYVHHKIEDGTED